MALINVINLRGLPISPEAKRRRGADGCREQFEARKNRQRNINTDTTRHTRIE